MAKNFNQINMSNYPPVNPLEYHVRGEKRNHRELFSKNIVAIFRVGDNEETRETSLSTFTESMKTVLKVESGTVADCIMVSVQNEIKDNRRKFRLNIFLLPGVETACLIVRTSYKSAKGDWIIHREPMWIAVSDKISLPLLITKENDLARDEVGKYLIKIEFDFAFIDDNNLFPAQGPLPVHSMPDFRQVFAGASVKVQVEGKLLYYLESLLKMVSPVLKSDLEKMQDKIINVENVSYNDMLLLLKLLYPASSSVITLANADTVLKLASRFDITHLRVSAEKIKNMCKKEVV